MNLNDLGAQFVKFSAADEVLEATSLAEAEGVQFRCPECNGLVTCKRTRSSGARARGTFSDPKWDFSGTGLGDLSLEHSLVRHLCGWKGVIAEGVVNDA